MGRKKNQVPTKRIGLTVNHDLNSLLDELADLTGTPKAKLIVEFLDEMTPVLVDLRDGLSMVKQSRNNLPSVMAKLLSTQSQANAKIAFEASELSKQLLGGKND